MSDDDEIIPMYDALRYPGGPGPAGLPPRLAERASSMPGWSRLARGAGLGQKANLFYDPDVDATQIQPVGFLELPGDRGSDLDACQLQITLAPPRAIPRDARDLPIDIANMTGEMDNATMGSFGDYPGTTPAAPIAWPPFIYIVEWGVGGTRAKAEIDAVNGACINVTASWVRVYAAAALDGVENAPGTKGVYTLAAFVGPGYPRTGSAQRSVFLGDVVSQNSSDVFAVPAFAKDVTVLANLVDNATVTYVNFYQDPAGLLPVATYLVTGNQPGPFRVPNAGAYFNVQNGLGSTAAFVALFELSI